MQLVEKMQNFVKKSAEIIKSEMILSKGKFAMWAKLLPSMFGEF